jgi:hypothetical protein
MPAKPTHVVRRADGSEAGALFDLASQRKVGLRVTDPALARLLEQHGIAPARPPFLEATTNGVHGSYAPRPQRNWFLAPPLADAAAALQQVLEPAGYRLTPL